MKEKLLSRLSNLIYCILTLTLSSCDEQVYSYIWIFLGKSFYSRILLSHVMHLTRNKMTDLPIYELHVLHLSSKYHSLRQFVVPVCLCVYACIASSNLNLTRNNIVLLWFEVLEVCSQKFILWYGIVVSPTFLYVTNSYKHGGVYATM